jgi:hypothetical protein
MTIIKVDFTENQSLDLVNAYKNNKSVRIQLNLNNFNEKGVPLNLTTKQIESINKGNYNILFSKSQVKAIGKNKSGGALPLLALLPLALKGLAALGAAGAAAGGAAQIANAVHNKKFQEKTINEQQRHNKALEGQGMYLKPYPGDGMYLKPYKGEGFQLNKKLKKN